ncbi:hypothetical protein D3C72_790240 [compost metagenome]
MPRASVNAAAPSTPKGSTSSTEIGTDQLSYKAESKRNTTTSDSASSSATWLPACRSSNAVPVHS